MRAVAWLVVLAGCGRFGFGSTDGNRDGASGDGLIGDGAIGDGAIGDGGTGDAADPACLQGYSVCDGFEGGTIDTSTWMIDPAVTLDTTHVHRGLQSAKVHMDAFGVGQNRYVSLDETKTITAGATTFWVRAWLWLSALPAGGNGLELITAERPGSAGDYVFVFSNRTSVYTQFGSQSMNSTSLIPVGSWFCAIFKVVRSTGNTGSLDLSGTGPMIPLPNVQTDAAQPMQIITIGIGFSGSNVPDPQPALDLWVDDVIVHTSAVTCAD